MQPRLFALFASSFGGHAAFSDHAITLAGGQSTGAAAAAAVAAAAAAAVRETSCYGFLSRMLHLSPTGLISSNVIADFATDPETESTMADSDAVQFAKALSRLLGWIYTLSWSLSFYPQPLLNYQRRSTVGALIDYPAINFLGFLFYFLSTTLLFASSVIRKQYADRHPEAPEPTVRANDVAFGAHALLLTAITVSQWWGRLWGFAQAPGQLPKRYVSGVAIGCVVGTAWVAVLVGFDGGWDASGWAWLDIVYAMEYCKLMITFVKYVPQAWSNYVRGSTLGWSIGQVVLDLVGGVLSVSQLLIDSGLEKDWSGVTGNPVKFGLGNVSVIFDLIFMVQHYILYRGRGKDVADGEERPLLDGERRGLQSTRSDN